jgi:hypothetical protein
VSTHAAVQGAVSRTSARVTKARGGKETLRFLGIEARKLGRRSGIRLNPERESQCATFFHHAPDFTQVVAARWPEVDGVDAANLVEAFLGIGDRRNATDLELNAATTQRGTIRPFSAQPQLFVALKSFDAGDQKSLDPEAFPYFNLLKERRFTRV